ncbi:MAG TPA: cytochrome c oxidase subunit II [Candidatus Baltobacteraceae bacterium]|jgi:cytochrome c oxidase subunit 2
MAQQARPKQGLGPGFWPVTILLTVITVVCDYYVVVTPITNFLREAATPADQTDELFKFLTFFGVIVFVYTIGYLVYFAIVWRKKKSDPEDTLGIQIHGSFQLELWWTILPTLLVIAIGWISVKDWTGIFYAQGGQLAVEAIGYQFGWEFRYQGLPNPVPDELHLPVGVPTTIHISSRDVIHGFWTPEVRLKQDAVPGLVTTIHITPTEVGTYRIICSEYCGARHGYMVGKLIIEPKATFTAFLDKEKYLQAHAPKGPGGLPPGVNLANGNASAGQTLFAQKCSACHSLGAFSQKLVGPGLGKVFADPDHPKLVDGAAATPEDAAGIINSGFTGDMGTMPNAKTNGLSNDDIANLVVYLEGVSKGQ